MDHSVDSLVDMGLQDAFEGAGLPVGPSPAACEGHDVQFYSTEAHLVKSVVGFLADGLNAGQPIVVIATAVHRRAFHDGLRHRGLDPDEVMSGREALWLDARETLSSFMEGGLPHRDLFMQTVGRVFERLLKKRYYLTARAYGEMVDLLWRDGNTEGAIQLEQLWNELAARYSFGLLCTYSLNHFLNEAGAEGIRRVCAHHTHAVPLERRHA